MGNWRRVALEEKTRALLDVAERLTSAPDASSEHDIERLRCVGWDDTAIHDAVQIISYFNYINRVADALGVVLDEGAKTWGPPPQADSSHMGE